MPKHVDECRPYDNGELPPMPLPKPPPWDLASRVMLGFAGLALVLGLAIAGLTIYGAVTMSVTEDSPAWDCRTMGNHICGVPVLTPVHPEPVKS